MIISAKYMFFLIMTVGVLGGAVIFGLKETVQVKSVSQMEVEAIVHPFKLVTSLNKTEYMLGESITIDLRLINIGNSTVTLTFRNRSPPTWLRFKVYNASDDLVFTSLSFAWEAFTVVSLDPGSFIGQTYEWDQKDGDLRYPDTIHQLNSGAYKIIGFLDELYALNGSGIVINLETPPILISIG
jgi:hypothetical protein